MPRGDRPPGGPKGYLTEEEKANSPKASKELLLRILSYLKPYRLQFILVFFTILISSVLGLLPSIITGQIVDQALLGGNMGLLVRLLAAAFITLVASQLIGMAQSYINAWISQRIIFDMKNQMFQHLQQMPHAFFTTEKQGDIITRMNSDIGGVSSVISGTLTNVVQNVTLVATTLVALFSLNWKLALVGVAVLPLLILPTRKVGRVRWTLLGQSQQKSDELNEIVGETLSVSGSMLVKLFTREEREYERFYSVNDQLTRLAMREQNSGKWFHVMMGMFTNIGPLLIYFAGGYLILSHWDTSLTVGIITATVALVNRMYRPVQDLMNTQVDFTRSLALFTRIFDYFDRTVDIDSPVNAVKPDITGGDISFSHVNFSYEPGRRILKDVSFTVPCGKMYAIVGPSGSGKSTLVNLIPRLYDVEEGAVTVAGVDVRAFDLAWLREKIGVVTQDTYLFNGTIRDNLLYAKPDATEEELSAACTAANIDTLIARQPQGYDTVVGNRGLKLSGGEKQRISIARVILKNPSILILDEATSALDSISESAIQDALEALMRGRTSIVIAHRLSTVLAAERILVLDGGHIVEQGGHDDLLTIDGVYRQLYETQFRRVMEHEQEAEHENGIIT